MLRKVEDLHCNPNSAPLSNRIFRCGRPQHLRYTHPVACHFIENRLNNHLNFLRRPYLGQKFIVGPAHRPRSGANDNRPSLTAVTPSLAASVPAWPPHTSSSTRRASLLQLATASRHYRMHLHFDTAASVWFLFNWVPDGLITVGTRAGPPFRLSEELTLARRISC